jgi:bile acid-coenzyme A ligase
MSMTETPLGVALHNLAQAKPNTPAITCNDMTVSRAELDSRTNRLARAYAELGVGQGSLVTIALPNSIAFYEAVIAAWKLGAVPQPVSYRLPPRELTAIVELANPVIVVGLNPGNGQAWLPAGFEPDTGLSEEPLPPAVSPVWKAPTSGGSTGRPKLILAGSPAIAELIVGAAARVNLEPEGVMLCPAPLYHNGPFTYSLISLLLGNHVVVMERFDPVKTLELIERYKVTWMYSVPTMLRRILLLPEEERLTRDMSSIRTVIHMAAPCPPTVKRAWIGWLGAEKIMELYAGTEAQAATIINGREWLEHAGSVGQVAYGEMKIFDAEGVELPTGEVGEVWMRSPEGITTYRYIGATATRRNGWETLGDMGYFDADGYLYLADRKTDMILVGGSNVYPAEVEAALTEHPKVLAACVIGLPDEDYGNIVHAIINLTGEISDDALRAHLAERLVAYKIPRSFERTGETLRDEADKIRRSALRQTRIEKRNELG